MARNRFRIRLIQHIVLAAVSFACTALFMRLFPNRDLISRLSIGSAYPALFFAVAAMLLGPANVLRRRANPISFDLRRDIAIWAGFLAVFHTVVGLNVHLRGRMWLYFMNEHHGLRRDWFGFGNYSGIAAALLFVLLLVLSNDLSLRKLGHDAGSLCSAGRTPRRYLPPFTPSHTSRSKNGFRFSRRFCTWRSLYCSGCNSSQHTGSN